MPAAVQGLAAAQYSIGVEYQFDRVFDKDLNQSFLWLKKSADQGCLLAYYFLYLKVPNFRKIQNCVPRLKAMLF